LVVAQFSFLPTVESRELTGHAAQGYSGIVLAWAYG